MSKTPELQKKIVRLVEKELKDTNPIEKQLIISLLHSVYLNRNKTTSQNIVTNKLEAEIRSAIESRPEE